ncbi:MAG TPA: hypothetical protein VE978_10115 [Chitinophagales bacterium]|nr:hypothetical protein [Chitinophagales bacterium]
MNEHPDSHSYEDKFRTSVASPLRVLDEHSSSTDERRTPYLAMTKGIEKVFFLIANFLVGEEIRVKFY